MTTTLITGASSGIGLELAKLAAADGNHLVLVARSEDKLKQLAADLEAALMIKATVIVSDLSKPDAVDRVYQSLQDASIDVDTLINNAGFGALGDFADLSNDRQTHMMVVNMVGLTRLTRKLLPGMIQRNQGGILNVGSIAGYQAGPHMAVYYATKAYVMSFTEAVREELKDTDPHATLLAPGATETGFGEDSDMGSLDMFSSQTMTAKAVAEAAYKGFQENKDVVIPGWKNHLMASSAGFLPRSFTRKLVGKMQDEKPE